MLFSSVAQYLRSGFRPRVCIVGTGPAGLSLALRLRDRKIPCLLLEAGGLAYSPASQDCYRGEVVGDPYPALHTARLRQFGGTSGHWTGWVRPLDASTFEPQSYLPHSGWPIRASDLTPYASAADALLQVEPGLADQHFTADIDRIQYRFSPPVRFGTAYRSEVEQSPAIGLLLNTPVLELVPGRGRIQSVQVATSATTSTAIEVDQLCVCTGGIENSRLLLWSNARHGGRVVPHADALGRYWMDHPVHTLADVVTNRGEEMAYENETPQKWFYAPSTRARTRHGIGGAHLWMRAHQAESEYAKELLHQAVCVAPVWSNRVLRRVGKEYHCGGFIESEFEQFPRPENRIELDVTSDALGVPRPRLYWSLADSERKTARTAIQLLGEGLVSHDIGRLRVRNFLVQGGAWPSGDHRVGYHHMGGTRMSATPSEGVVDRHCKVFGMDNLYIGGSSVFATSGHANPTYTIVQLALRLGDHLAGKLPTA